MSRTRLRSSIRYGALAVLLRNSLPMGVSVVGPFSKHLETSCKVRFIVHVIFEYFQ